MREKPSEDLEKCRVVNGSLASSREDGNNGVFIYPYEGLPVVAIVSCGGGWEHVSIRVHTTPERTPTWEEMSFAKNLFWDEEETVVQFHPPESRYVDNHPYVLHMWKIDGVNWPLPPVWMVGAK